MVGPVRGDPSKEHSARDLKVSTINSAIIRAGSVEKRAAKDLDPTSP